MLRKLIYYGALLLLVALVALVIANQFFDLTFLPEKAQAILGMINWWEAIALPVAFQVCVLLYRFGRQMHENDLIGQGLQLGTVQAQRLRITPCMQPTESEQESVFRLLLHWKDTAFASEEDAARWFGSKRLAELFQETAKAATEFSGSVIPRLSSLKVQDAYRNMITRLGSSHDGKVGEDKPFVIIAACEDRARIVRTRLFEAPPAMLLLFLKDVVHRHICTKRKEQWYRSIAMELIAKRLFGKGQFQAAAPRDGFSPGYYYSVRELPYKAAEDEFSDWWNPEWHFNPEDPSVTLDDLLKKRERLMDALIAAARKHGALPEAICNAVDENSEFGALRHASIRAAQDLDIALHV